MASIILYIACSLDGYIADDSGSVSWLDAFGDGGDDFGYTDFLQQVGTLLMGGRTYRQVLEFGEWPYPGKRTVVFTRHPVEGEAPPDVEFRHELTPALLETLRAGDSRAIWLVGGANLVAQVIRLQELDSCRIFIMPLVLGSGIPLFEPGLKLASLQLEQATPHAQGVVELRYRCGKQTAGNSG